MFLFAAPAVAKAAGTVLHVDSAAVYTTVPERADDKPYKSIEDALSKALDGDTIKLDTDIGPLSVTKSAPYKIPAGMKLTLDLNGKTITATDETTSTFYLFENKGDFTVTDTADGGMIALKNNKSWNTYTESAAVMNNGGKVTISQGTISSTGANFAFAVDNLASQWNSGSVDCHINGGKLISSYSPVRLYSAAAKCDGKLTIKNGTIQSKGKYSPVFLQESPQHGNLTVDISGGTYEAAALSSYPLPVIYWWNSPCTGTSTDITISGGTFDKNLTAVLNYWNYTANADVTSYGALVVSGGTFEAAPYVDANTLKDPQKVTVKNGLSEYVLKNIEYEGDDGVDCYTVLGGYPPNITTKSLPDGVLGDEYSQKLAADGSKSIKWSIADGTLPDGLKLDDSTGAISGTPTKIGKWTFTVKATNSLGENTHEYAIEIGEGAAVTLEYVAKTGGSVSNAADKDILPLSGTPKGSTAAADSGYDFVSWTDKDGKVVSTAATFVPSKNSSERWKAATYYANFQKKAPVNYTLTFVINGGSEIQSITKPSGTTISLTDFTPEKKGYTFGGWYSDPALKNSVTSIVIDQDTKIYAKWIPNATPTTTKTVSASPTAAKTTSSGSSEVKTGDDGDIVLWTIIALTAGFFAMVSVGKLRSILKGGKTRR